MNATEIKVHLENGLAATRPTWEPGTIIVKVPGKEEYTKVLPDGKTENYDFQIYDVHETDWSVVEKKTQTSETEPVTEEPPKVEEPVKKK